MYLVFKNYLFKEFCGLYLNTYMEKYQSPCHNSLDLIIIHNYKTRNCTCIHAPVGPSEASYRIFGYRGIYI